MRKNQELISEFTRTAFTTDRVMEFFTESELTTQIGYGKALWPLVLSKELIDNALDACEGTRTAPVITITLEPDGITVADNGPGLNPEIIKRSLDYRIRISDKKYYVAPTRGQLGNALKCVWAASFVANGEGLVEVTACGLHHRIEIHLNRIAQAPDISHTITPSVKNGTSVTVHWPGIASLEPHDQTAEFYQTETVSDALPALMADFATFNPHATFHLRLPSGHSSYPASDSEWSKWLGSQATSSHWYRVADLCALIAAEVRENGHKTIRDFVAEFDGLAGTQYRKRVLTEANIPDAAYLDDLVVNGDIDNAAAGRLLTAMQQASRPVKPQRLGVIGKEHLQAALVTRGVSSKGFTYRKACGTGDDGLPFVVETAFGVKKAGQRELIIGLNNSPVFKVPSGHLSDILADCRVQAFDPIVLVVHLGCPRFEFTDHGKGSIV